MGSPRIPVRKRYNQYYVLSWIHNNTVQQWYITVGFVPPAGWPHGGVFCLLRGGACLKGGCMPMALSEGRPPPWEQTLWKHYLAPYFVSLNVAFQLENCLLHQAREQIDVMNSVRVDDWTLSRLTIIGVFPKFMLANWVNWANLENDYV